MKACNGAAMLVGYAVTAFVTVAVLRHVSHIGGLALWLGR